MEKSPLNQDIEKFIDECIAKEHPESYLIAVLHRIQGEYGYLSVEHMDRVAQRLSVPTSEVYGVATFYHFFRLNPKGQYAVSICMGTACFVKGADKVLSTFEDELGIEVGETTSDGLFSLEQTRCIGVCAMAPVVTVNEKIYSNVDVNKVPEILNEIRAEYREKKEMLANQQA